MTQPDNTFDSYDANGIREDLSDIIYDVSPDETPFYSRCKKTKATNTFFEWQTDTLRSSAVNAHVEGDDTTAEARTATARLGNYTQIFKNAVVIPDTDEGLNKAGRGKEIAYQIMKVAKEQKLDIEKALFDNTARASGSSSVARKLAGIPSWITTNTQAGSGGGDPATIGANTRTDGTQRAITQTMLNTALQDAWTAGGKPDVVYASPFQVNAIAGFTGSNNQRNTVDRRKVSYAVDVYMTSFGTVEVQPSRECRGRDLFVVQSDMWKVPVLRGTKQTPLAKTGDNTKRQVVTELTFAACNEASSAAVYDLTTS